MRKDLWVVCDNLEINFPVPYLTNYVVSGINRDDPDDRTFWESNLSDYLKPEKIKTPVFVQMNCPFHDCKAHYKLHNRIAENGSVICPTCLKRIPLQGGWPTAENMEEWDQYVGSKRGTLTFLLNWILR